MIFGLLLFADLCYLSHFNVLIRIISCAVSLWLDICVPCTMRDSLFLCVSALFNASMIETLQFLLNSRTMILKKQSMQWLIFFLMSKFLWVFARGIQLFRFIFLLVNWVWCLCNCWLYLHKETHWAPAQALHYGELQHLNICRLPCLSQISYSQFWSMIRESKWGPPNGMVEANLFAGRKTNQPELSYVSPFSFKVRECYFAIRDVLVE